MGPHGDRVTVRALGHDDTVAGLAERLDASHLWAHDRMLAPAERLVDIDELRIGTHLRSDPDPAVRAANSRRDADRVQADDREADPREAEHGEADDREAEHGEADQRAVVEMAVVAGPASSDWMPLRPGRHLIGRAHHAHVHLDDPAIEPHHALLTVGADGTCAVTQLCGAAPVRINDELLQPGEVLGVGDRITVGSSTLTIRLVGSDPRAGSRVSPLLERGDAQVGSVAPHPTDPWRRIVWRAPHRPPGWSAEPVVAPASLKEPARPALTGLIGVAVTAAGAVVIAQVMGNAMFMLFAGMGVIASVTTFIVGTVTARRRRNKMRAEHADRLVQFSCAVDLLHAARLVHHRAMHCSVVATHHEALHGGPQLWQRRIASDDDTPLRAVVGTGSNRWRPDIVVDDPAALDASLMSRVDAASILDGVEAPISIRNSEVLALHGPAPLARSVARSIVVQLATWVGPADWQLVVISRHRRAWQWSDWLPHGALDDAALITIATDDDTLSDALDSVDVERLTLVVTDEPQLFTARTGPLRRFMGASQAAAIVVVGTDETVPSMCRRVLTIGSTGSASWTGDLPNADDTVGIRFAGISVDAADRIARRLACLVDPEDDGGAGGGVPRTVSFGELIPPAEATADAIAARWRDGGADPAPAAPLGWSVDGRVDIDLVRDGPHGLIAGTTGSGKSELLRTLVVSLAASVGPQHLNFVLVDYKGGSTFDACIALPHTVGLVTDLDDGLAERALVSLDAELHRRERMLRAVGAADLTDYRSRRDAHGHVLDPMARLVVVIDEFAALAKELPDFLKALVGIAQRGRSLGVHLLLATQRPAGVVNDDIRANTNLRLALRLHDRPDAVDVVGNELPAKFPRGLPGRAALRLGPDELVVFQAARCTGAPADDVEGGMIVESSGRRSTTASQPGTGAGERDAGEGHVERSELTETVRAIVDAATGEGVDAPHRPWVEPLPFPLLADPETTDPKVPTSEVEDGVIGIIDDPLHQRRVPLAWQPSDGGLALVGSIGSGTTCTMISLAASVCRARPPDRLHLYVIDARGDDGLGALSALAHCGGVVRLVEDERMHRLLSRVVKVIDQRMSADAAVGPDIVLMIDGYSSVRTSLGAVDRQASFELLQRVVNDGPAAGVSVVLADEANSAMSMVAVSNRWIFHLDDPSAARSLGLRTAPVPADKPGRLRILACGREAQVELGAAGLAALPTHLDDDSGPEPIEALPELVDARGLQRMQASEDGTVGGALALCVGVSSSDLSVAHLAVTDGDHILIIGPPRSGVSTTLTRCATAWADDARERGTPFQMVYIGRRTPLDPASIADPNVRVCIVADDAHRVDDDGVLMAIAKGEHDHVTIIAGGRGDGVRSAYGHWTREVARARCGIVMSSRGDSDGDLLGAVVPRRSLIPARPGLGWLVDGGPIRLVQIATD